MPHDRDGQMKNVIFDFCCAWQEYMTIFQGIVLHIEGVRILFMINENKPVLCKPTSELKSDF